MPVTIKFLNSLSILLIFFLLSGCRKDGGITENRVTVTKTDLSIPTNCDIVEFCSVNEDMIFAIGTAPDGLVKLFKTSDGGKSWEEMNLPAISSGPLIQSIVFLDEFNGIVVFDNRAYRTYDGGGSWSSYIKAVYPPDGNYSYDFIFAGKTDSGDFLLVESNGNPWIDNHIYISSAYANDYTVIASFNHDGDRYDHGHYANGKFFYIARDFNNWEQTVLMYDLSTGQMNTLQVLDNTRLVMDAIYANGKVAFARMDGKINFAIVNSGDESDTYRLHDNDYHSIEFADNYFIAVAERSITTNFNGKWEEAINPDGTGHTEHFMKIQKISQTHFYISGTNGLFIKATFK